MSGPSRAGYTPAQKQQIYRGVGKALRQQYDEVTPDFAEMKDLFKSIPFSEMVDSAHKVMTESLETVEATLDRSSKRLLTKEEFKIIENATSQYRHALEMINDGFARLDRLDHVNRARSKIFLGGG
jgi:hypothetical protein